MVPESDLEMGIGIFLFLQLAIMMISKVHLHWCDPRGNRGPNDGDGQDLIEPSLFYLKMCLLMIPRNLTHSLFPGHAGVGDDLNNRLSFSYMLAKASRHA